MRSLVGMVTRPLSIHGPPGNLDAAAKKEQKPSGLLCQLPHLAVQCGACVGQARDAHWVAPATKARRSPRVLLLRS